MDSKTVLVTGIGGNVRQGILRNIKALGWNIKLIGCDIASFSPGNHLCDLVYKVPYSYEVDYISKIHEIVLNHDIDLIIPSTDFEIYYLGENKKKFKCEVLASEATISKLFLDKYLTYLLFEENNIPFAKSWLPKDFDYSVDNYIVKPRKGRGSRGIMINAKNVEMLGEDYMVQPYHQGIEITTAVYVNKQNKVHGIFSMERKLENGTTSQTIINTDYDDDLLEMAKKVTVLGGIKGSFNIQSIIENGKIFPFEINCRISGTNSIRHNLGFQDVKYGLQEYLYNLPPDQIYIKNKKAIATRVLMDVIYPDATSFEELNNNSSKHFIY